MNGFKVSFYILTFALISNVANAYKYKKEVLLRQDIKDVEFSPDQKYLIATSDKYFELYNGVTGSLINHIRIPEDKEIKTFSFSQDNTLLALGYVGGGILLTAQIHGFDPSISRIFNLNETSSIVSLCFSADNRRILFLNQQTTQIGIIDITTTSDRISYFEHKQGQANFLQCSPSRSLQFMVGGGTAQDPSLTLYKYDLIQKNVEVKNIFNMEDRSSITSGTYSPEGSVFYAINTDYIVRIINPYNFQTQNISLEINSTSSPIKKMRVNKELNMFALAGEFIVFSITITPDNDTLWSGQESQLAQILIEEYPTRVNSVALGPSGGNFFYIDLNQVGQLLSECGNNQYFDPTNNLCQSCSENCTDCLNSANQCYGCKQGNYLNNTICQSCMPNCGLCLGPMSCVKCRPTFTYRFGQCTCVQGYFLNTSSDSCQACPENCTTCNAQQCQECKHGYQIENDKCVQSGALPEWLIVIIILVVVAILASICVGLSNHSKKKKMQQQRLLVEEQMA